MLILLTTIEGSCKVKKLTQYPNNALFISHQSDQSFLEYGQYSAWPWQNTFEIWKRKQLAKKKFFLKEFFENKLG